MYLFILLNSMICRFKWDGLYIWAFCKWKITYSNQKMIKYISLKLFIQYSFIPQIHVLYLPLELWSEFTQFMIVAL